MNRLWLGPTLGPCVTSVRFLLPCVLRQKHESVFHDNHIYDIERETPQPIVLEQTSDCIGDKQRPLSHNVLAVYTSCLSSFGATSNANIVPIAKPAIEDFFNATHYYREALSARIIIILYFYALRLTRRSAALSSGEMFRMHVLKAALFHMGINLSCGNIRMTEHHLDRPQVCAVVQKVRGK